MEIKAEYQKIKEKYKLPPFEYMDNEFEVSAIKIPDSGVFIKATLRAINNKVGLIINYLEPVITPQQTMHSMIELNGITEEEKKDIYLLYKSLGLIYHNLCLAELEAEEKIAEQINKTTKEWSKLKPKIIICLNMINKTWEKAD